MSSATAVNPATTEGFTEATLAAFLRGRAEPAWLSQRRRDAFATFLATPLPSARDEEWRRTDIRAFKLNAFEPPAAGPAGAAESAAIEPLYQALATHYATGIAQVNGAVTRTADPARLGGAVFIDLATAAKEHPALLERFLLTQAVSASADAFSALHGAFWTGGTLLYVPKGVKVEAPLFSL
ncbi:MAG: Fe-S cluster assembly protein SufD, partial [Isosphaeraceae bacterium]|nr:Fe-S cluster assembly protein SufD [Isosphaeraceae bacterium]